MGRTACTEPQCLYKGALYLIGCSPVKIYFWLSQDCLWVKPELTTFTVTMLPAFTVTMLPSHSRGSTLRWENAITKIYMMLIYVVYSPIYFNFPICTSRSQWPRGLRHRSATARLLRLWVLIPPRAWMSVCCECCVLSGRGLCDELITGPKESYRLWFVVLCDLETSWMRRPWPTGGCCAKRKKEGYVLTNK
jgi:hypothetical protein